MLDGRHLEAELAAIASFVHERCGIAHERAVRKLARLPLAERMARLGFQTPAAYLGYLRADPASDEVTALLDAITTNHTSFFREPQHFEWLRTHIVPAIGPQGLDIWCAASATGEEAISIAITLREAGLARFRVIATDLSTAALRTAQAGIYPLPSVAGLPLSLLRRHFEKGHGAYEGLVRVSADIRRHLEFRRLNLLDADTRPGQFVVIFCRNLLIHLDESSRQRVVTRLEAQLRPGGHLFVAHTERLAGLRHALSLVAPAVYRKAS